jgi:hypothetical protein
VGLEAIFAEFPARLGPDIVFAGPRDRDANSRPPRIAWDAVSDSLVPPPRIGGGPGDDGPVYSRRWSIAVEVWGRDLDEAIALADLFIATAHELLSQHAFRAGNSSWHTGGRQGLGAVCAMSIELRTLVPKTTRPTRAITEINPSYLLNDTAV